MADKRFHARLRAFTLIEVLTVIAIISLLMAILLPALSKARDQTRCAATAAKLRAIEVGCDLFREELERYPHSTAHNRFEPPPYGPPCERYHVQGAQVLFMEIVGVDTLGFVRPVRLNDTNNDHIINWIDWQEWYSPCSEVQVSRYGPYVEVEPAGFSTPRRYMQMHPQASRPALNMLGERDGGIGGRSHWNNGRLPFFVDSFGFPIIYYQAHPFARRPVSVKCRHHDGCWERGVFDRSHNAGITGFARCHGSQCYDIPFKGWDLTGVGFAPDELVHPLGELGYDPSDPQRWPERGTFAWFVCDRRVFEAIEQASEHGGRLKTYKRESFILISPGQDGRYGTADDIHNFERRGF